MTYWDKTNWNCYLEQVEDLLETPRGARYAGHPPSPRRVRYEHSVFVSYTAFRLARKWGLDYRAAARAGLLHDLYLYDPRSLRSYRQCFAHPAAALRNAVQAVRRAFLQGGEHHPLPHVAHGPPPSPLPGGADRQSGG